MVFDANADLRIASHNIKAGRQKNGRHDAAAAEFATIFEG